VNVATCLVSNNMHNRAYRVHGGNAPSTYSGLSTDRSACISTQAHIDDHFPSCPAVSVTIHRLADDRRHETRGFRANQRGSQSSVRLTSGVSDVSRTPKDDVQSPPSCCWLLAVRWAVSLTDILKLRWIISGPSICKSRGYTTIRGDIVTRRPTAASSPAWSR